MATLNLPHQSALRLNSVILTAPILSLILLCFPQQSHSHGRLLEPPMRASIWRFPEFDHLNPPINYNDNEFFCGNMTLQYEQNGGKCGVCGDNWTDPEPRSHEDGGLYGVGIIVRNYTSGQTIPIQVELTSPHGGYFEFRLCERNSRSDPETESCYEKHLLQLGNGLTRLPATQTDKMYTTTAKLPEGLTCRRCVLQWHYKTGNSWGYCGDGTQATGCGDQETFRGCADVAIY